MFNLSWHAARLQQHTTPRYDKAAATLAWQRTMDFFKKNLRGEC